MIITCPECAARYDVDDDRFFPNGRSVRCTACGESWYVPAPEALDMEPLGPASSGRDPQGDVKPPRRPADKSAAVGAGKKSAAPPPRAASSPDAWDAVRWADAPGNAPENAHGEAVERASGFARGRDPEDGFNAAREGDFRDGWENDVEDGWADDALFEEPPLVAADGAAPARRRAAFPREPQERRAEGRRLSGQPAIDAAAHDEPVEKGWRRGKQFIVEDDGRDADRDAGRDAGAGDSGASSRGAAFRRRLRANREERREALRFSDADEAARSARPDRGRPEVERPGHERPDADRPDRDHKAHKGPGRPGEGPARKDADATGSEERRRRAGPAGERASGDAARRRLSAKQAPQPREPREGARRPGGPYDAAHDEPYTDDHAASDLQGAAAEAAPGREATIVDADFEDVDGAIDPGFGRRIRAERRRATAVARIEDVHAFNADYLDEEFFASLRVTPRELERALRKARRRAEARDKNRLTPWRAFGWTAWAAMIAGVVYLGLAYRDDIVRIAPQTAQAYAVIGVETNPSGLSIGEVRHRLAMSTAGPTIEITGSLRNDTGADAAAPLLQAEALGPRGELLSRWTFSASDAAVAPGASVAFVTRAPAPDGVVEVALSFAPTRAGVRGLLTDTR